MATTTVSYGSISIVDVTDVGELSIYPKSNLPQSIIYNPDQHSFTPNWSESNLILSPSIWYGGEQLSTEDNNVNVTWSRREGIGSVDPLTTGEMISDGTLMIGGETIPKGTLVVNANKFTENSTMLTYIVTISYQEPTLSQALTAQGEITFTMTKNSSNVKSATITGETIFKYNGDGTIKGASTITLTGRVTGSGVNISAWQYQKADGTWATYPNSTTNPTLTVNATDNVFTNDKCIIRLYTTDEDIYDLHTITKLKDGTAGTDTVSAVLTNEDQMIPFNSSGQGDFTDAVSQIIVYESGEDVTSQWGITVTYDSNNLTVTTSKTTVANDTVAITGMNSDTGTVTFTANKSGHAPIVKQFSVIKIAPVDGKSPVIYSLEPTTLAMNKTIDTTPVYTPTSVTFYAYQTQDQTKSAYKGRFKIYENVLASAIPSSTTAKYTSSKDESSYLYTPSASCKSIVCVLYQSGGTTTKLDTQTIAITTDGQTGKQGNKGDDGTDALNIIVGNSYDGIPVDSNGKTTTSYTVLIPFAGYQGTNKVATTVVKNNNNQYPSLFGLQPELPVTDATTTADGLIQYIIPAGTTITNDNGVVTFTFRFTEANKTVTYDYSWGKARQGKDGTNGINAVILQLGTPEGGNIIENGTGTVKIVATLIDGATDVTNSATYIWKKFENGSYNAISGQTSKELTVTNSMVNGYASFQCIAHYNNEDYIQYMSVIDKQDPIQVTVLSSVGDKLVNGNGVGAIYAMVYRNGKELDPIKSERFVDTLPTSGNKNGDYCYLLDSTAKTVTLYKYTTKWNVATDTYTGTYNWYYRDMNGNTTTTGTPSAGGAGAKVIYIDGDLVDKKLTIDVKVTI